MAIDIKTSVTRIVVLEMTEEDATKLYRACSGDLGIERDKDDYEVLNQFSRAIHNALHPNMPSPTYPPGVRGTL